MSADEENAILILSEDEDDGDDVQYIKEEKAPPITIDETDDQDDVIFVSTCPAPPPPLPTDWDDALALDTMDLDSFPLSVPTSSCSTDGTHMAGGSSLSVSFCPLLDSSSAGVTPSPLTSLTTDLNNAKLTMPVLGSDLSTDKLTLPVLSSDMSSDKLSLPVLSSDLSNAKISLPVLGSDLNNAKLPMPVLGSDLSVGAASDLSDSSNSLTALSGAALSLSSVTAMTSALASFSTTTDLTMPSVSGTLSGLPGGCQHAGAVDASKNLMNGPGSQALFPFCPTSSPLDLSRQDKAGRPLGLRKKKKRRSELSLAVGAMPQDSTCEDTSSDDSHGLDVSDSDDSFCMDRSDNSDDQGNSDDDDGSSLPTSLQSKSRVAGVSSIAATTTMTSCPSSPTLSAWLDLSLSSSDISSSQPSSSSSSASLQTVMHSSTHSLTTVPVITVSSVNFVGASLPSSSSQSSFSNHNLKQASVASQPAVTSSSSTPVLLALHSDPASAVSAATCAYPCSVQGTSGSAGPLSSTIQHVCVSPVSVSQPSVSSVSVSQVSVTSVSQPSASLVSMSVSQQSVSPLSVSSMSVNQQSASQQPMSQPSVSFHSVTSKGSANQGHNVSLAGSNSSSVGSSSFSGVLPHQAAGKPDDLFLNKSLLKQVASYPQQASSSSASTSNSNNVGASSGTQIGSLNLDFLDKIFDDCNSILSLMYTTVTTASSTTPAVTATCTSLLPVTTTSSYASPFPATPAVTSSSQSFNPISSTSASSNCSTVDTVAITSGSRSLTGKGTKRPNPSSLSSLDNASLPPRKRVLKHRADSTPFPGPVPKVLSAGLQDSVLPTDSRVNNLQQAKSSSMASTSGANVVVVPVTVTATLLCCKQCGKREGEKSEKEWKLSHCPQKHAACGDCLLVQARRVLSGKQKESLRCIDIGCNSFYHINELKNSLPALIVEILQERLDQDFVDYIDMISQKDEDKDDEDNSKSKAHSTKFPKSSSRKKSTDKRTLYLSSSSDADDEDDDNSDMETEAEDINDLLSDLESSSGREGTNSRRGSTNGEIQARSDFPEHWTPMDNSKNLVEVVAVPLEPDSEEYVKVAVRFHENMHFPAADVTRIVRIQNPYLWKSYSLKKEQMIQENGGRVVAEYQLFHGTKVNTIDAICRRGFDWRFCGKHGTAYGQGCYFAGDSLYSNAYTDRGSAPSNGSVFLKSIMQVPPTNTDPMSDLSVSSIPPSQPPPSLFNPQSGARAGPSGSTSSASSAKASLAMKKLLPLLKGKGYPKNPLIAHLLKLKGEVRARMNNSGGSSSAPRPGGSGGSRTSSGGFMYGSNLSMTSQPMPNPMFPVGRSSGHSAPGPGHPASASAHPTGLVPPGSAPQHPVSVPGPHPQTPTVSSIRQGLYSHHRYSLLAGPPRSNPSAPSASNSFVPGQPQGLHSAPHSLHPAPTTSIPPQSSFAGPGKGGYLSQNSKKYMGRTTLGAGGKLSAMMVRSSSSSTQPSGQGGVMAPVGAYPTNLAVTNTAITIPGSGTVTLGGGAQSLALLAGNTNSQPNSYFLVTPLAPNAAPLPPLGPLAPHPHPILGQTGGLPGPKPGPSWPSTSQALDLRKAGSCPRYMFMAKVLTGLSTGGQSDYRRPPPLDPLDPLGRCYDSCVDNIHNPRIWVIFDSTQAYPEYAIEYYVNGDAYR